MCYFLDELFSVLFEDDGDFEIPACGGECRGSPDRKACVLHPDSVPEVPPESVPGCCWLSLIEDVLACLGFLDPRASDYTPCDFQCEKCPYMIRREF